MKKVERPFSHDIKKKRSIGPQQINYNTDKFLKTDCFFIVSELYCN